MKKINFLFALLLIATLSFSQKGIFLQVGSLPGDQPEGQAVLAYSHGVSNSGSAHTGGGAGMGKANVQDLSLTMFTGKMTREFLRGVTLGTHFPEMKLKFYNSSKVLYYQITITDVLVSSISYGASCGANSSCEKQTENVSFNFSEIKWEDFGNNSTYDYDIE
ncbi:MAG: Hcp family type VI secretion system effector [Chitinophagaceae bacterium]